MRAWWVPRCPTPMTAVRSIYAVVSSQWSVVSCTIVCTLYFVLGTLIASRRPALNLKLLWDYTSKYKELSTKNKRATDNGQLTTDVFFGDYTCQLRNLPSTVGRSFS